MYARGREMVKKLTVFVIDRIMTHGHATYVDYLQSVVCAKPTETECLSKVLAAGDRDIITVT